MAHGWIAEVTVKGREKMAEPAADMPLYLTYRIKCVTVTTQSHNSLIGYTCHFVAYIYIIIKRRENPGFASRKKKKKKKKNLG